MLHAKCTSKYCVINNNTRAYISFLFVLCGSCELVLLGWYINDERNDLFFWQLLLNSDESAPLFILENWLRGRFTAFYWLYKYPARGASVLPLPPLSVFLPLFFSLSYFLLSFFLSEPFLCFVVFLLSSFIQKGKKTKTKNKTEDNNFSTFFFVLLFSFPSFLSSVRHPKEGRM